MSCEELDVEILLDWHRSPSPRPSTPFPQSKPSSPKQEAPSSPPAQFIPKSNPGSPSPEQKTSPIYEVPRTPSQSPEVITIRGDYSSPIKQEAVTPSPPTLLIPKSYPCSPSQGSPKSPKYEPPRTPSPEVVIIRECYTSPIQQEPVEEVEAKQYPRVWIAGMEPWRRRQFPVWSPGKGPK